MRISDWSSDVCSSDLAPPRQCSIYAQNVIEAWKKGRTALRQAQGERNLGPHWLRGSAQPAASEYRRAVALENPLGFDHRRAPCALERVVEGAVGELIGEAHAHAVMLCPHDDRIDKLPAIMDFAAQARRHTRAVDAGAAFGPEIGRASFRERGCQYV